MTDEQARTLREAGCQRTRIKGGGEDAWLWEYRGHLYRAEVALARIARQPVPASPAPETPVPRPQDGPREKVELPRGVWLRAMGFGDRPNVPAWFHADKRRVDRTVYTLCSAVALSARLDVQYDPALGAAGDARELQRTLQGWGYTNVTLTPRTP